MKNNEIPLLPDRVYHIYSHANGKENLFVKRDNYIFFLNKYAFYIEPIAETFAYCLMPNHIHIMIKVRPMERLQKEYMAVKSAKMDAEAFTVENHTEETIITFLSRTFGNLFSSYTQSFNKQQRRKGSLFIPNFKRKEITSHRYYKSVIQYIHRNPVHHGFVKALADWEFSSYKPLLSEKKTKLERDQVMNWFEDRNDFEQFHSHDKIIYKSGFIE